MSAIVIGRAPALALASGCAACASVPAPDTIRHVTVREIVSQVKCEIAAGLRTAGPGAEARRRVKGWAAKSALQLKGDQLASAGGSFGVTPLAPAPSFNLAFGSGEGFTETSEITFTDDLDTMGNPTCPNGSIEPTPGNNLGLASWLGESLNAFGPGNRTEFRQLGRTIVFTATSDTSGGIAFAVAPASLSLNAARKRSDTHTLTVALAEQAGPTIYQVRVVGGAAPAAPRGAAPPGQIGGGAISREAPGRSRFLSTPPGTIPQGTIENLNRMLDRQLQKLQ